MVSFMSRSGLKRPLSALVTSLNDSMPSQVTWIVLDMPGVQVHGDISRPVLVGGGQYKANVVKIINSSSSGRSSRDGR